MLVSDRVFWEKHPRFLIVNPEAYAQMPAGRDDAGRREYPYVLYLASQGNALRS